MDLDTYEKQLSAVKRNGYSLRFISEQSPELCMEAVKQDGWALQFVILQNCDICLEAVKKYGDALQFVSVQTPQMCLESFNQNANNLQYIKDENLKRILEKFDTFDEEVLEFILSNPEIENSFNDKQTVLYNDYCNTQLTKGCKE
jgi:hypothetical protein